MLYPVSMLAALCLAASMGGTRSLALVPERFEFREGELVPMYLREGDSATPWREQHVRWLFVRGGGRQANLDRVPPGPRVMLELSTPGATMIGLDAPWTVDAMGTRHVRSAAALLLVTAGDGDVPPSATAVSKSGLEVEIRPIMDPTNAAVGSDIAFRLYRKGDAQAGTALIARHADGESQRILTGPEGFATMHVTKPGVWLVSTMFTRMAAEVPEVCSGTLTFKVPEVQR